MADIIPFKGVLYDPQKVDVTSTVAPPYDVIAHDLKDELYNTSPHNIIRIDFGKDSDDDNDEENRYSRAAKSLSDWLGEGVLTNDPEPSFYCYEITYEINGQTKKTRGFFCGVRVEEIGKGCVRPHEMTYSKPKSDRLNILRYCNANTSPIYSLYSSTEKLASKVLEEVIKEPPFSEAKCRDGFTHRLWKIRDSSSIDTIMKDLADKDIFIADGHHRYETSLAFKKEMEEKGLSKTGDEPFNYVLMFLANMEDEGLTLLPTHRMVEVDSEINIKETLGQYFAVKRVGSEETSNEEARKEMLGMMHDSIHTFGMYSTNADAYYILTYNGADMGADMPDCLKDLDVSVLHKVIFEKLLNIEHYEYEMDPAIAVERAKKGNFEAVFFLNSTKIHDVRDVASAGHRMPPKSTYFFPKLLTGMVIYKFD